MQTSRRVKQLRMIARFTQCSHAQTPWHPNWERRILMAAQEYEAMAKRLGEWPKGYAGHTPAKPTPGAHP